MTSPYLDRPARTLAQLAEELTHKITNTPRALDAWDAAVMRSKVLAEIAERRKP